MNWTDARKYCQVIGRDLVSFANEKEMSKARAVINNDGNWWIGFTDERQEGNWVWSDGRSVTWTSWHSCCPRVKRNKNCAYLYANDGEWYDDPCSYEYNKFICRMNSGW